MTMQMKQSPDTVTSTLIELDHMRPPIAPLAMPKQVLAPQPGQLRRALSQLQVRLRMGLAHQSLRRAG